MTRKPSIVMTAIAYIEQHLNEKLDLHAIAEALHYSRYHLHRLFTETVGLTIHDYIVRRRISEGAKLLVFSDRSILDVAIYSGYETQQAFSTAFKALYKHTPKQYREQALFYPLQLPFILKETPTLYDADEAQLEELITLANEEDIPVWMDLVHLVIDGFPYLEERSYRSALQKSINTHQAYLLKDEDIAIGTLLFDPERGSIEFMAVHPQYRRSRVTKAFLNKILKELPDKNISITTFREGDKADTGYRKEYKELGFAESELLVEYGYPTQRFELKKKQEEQVDE